MSLDRKCAKAYGRRAIVYSAMASAELDKAKELARRRIPAERAEIESCLDKMNELRQKCIDDATEAIAANRHLARAYLTRGLAYATQSLTEKALADFNAAIREDPKMVRAYYNRGILFTKTRRFAAAIKDFEEAGKLQPAAAVIDMRTCLRSTR